MKRRARVVGLLAVAGASAALVPLGLSAPSSHENDQWLAFERQQIAGDPGSTQVYVRRIDGRDPGESGVDQKVTQSAGGSFNPTFDTSPSWGWVVFNHPPARDAPMRSRGLFAAQRMSLRFASRPIETDCGADCLEEFAPAVSPDETRIAFLAAYGPMQGDAADHVDLVVTSRDGGNRSVIRSSSWIRDGREPTYAPTWSPDGKRLAFVDRYRAGGSTLYVINADGTGLRRVTGRSLDARRPTRPSWAPADNVIAFGLERKADRVPEIHTIRADGRGLTRLTYSAGRTGAWAPAWSQSGERLAFARWDPQWEQSDIWVMRSDGKAQRRVKRTRENENKPAWSGG